MLRALVGMQALHNCHIDASLHIGSLLCRILSETDLETLWGDAGPCVGIERSKLQGALLPGVADLRCRLGTSVTFLGQDDHAQCGA
jgi:hypothetical protein